MRSWLLKFSYECILKKVLRPEVYKQLAAGKQMNCKADIRNPLSLLAHERSRFATCQWELLTPTDISIPLIHRLVLYHLKRGIAYSAFNSQEFIYQFSHYLIIEDKIYLMHSCICCGKSNRHDYFLRSVFLPRVFI